MGLAANFLPKMNYNISIGLRSGLFASHSNKLNFNFAIFSWTHLDVCQGARSCWIMYADLFGNFPIDCVNYCCRTSQYNIPFIVPSKIRAVVVAPPDMLIIPPSSVFICWMQSGRSHSLSAFQIFTWIFRLRTEKVDSSLKITFLQSWKVQYWYRSHHCTQVFLCFAISHCFSILMVYS